MKNLLKFFSEPVIKILIFLLTFYQKIFSPDHGLFYYHFGQNRCRFFPSCSDYAKESFRQYGLLRGLMVLCKRIIRCHPWSAGGYDPVK